MNYIKYREAPDFLFNKDSLIYRFYKKLVSTNNKKKTLTSKLDYSGEM